MDESTSVATVCFIRNPVSFLRFEGLKNLSEVKKMLRGETQGQKDSEENCFGEGPIKFRKRGVKLL